MKALDYFIKTCIEEHKKKHQYDESLDEVFTIKCTERWKTMTDAEKKRFNHLADGEPNKAVEESSKCVSSSPSAADESMKNSEESFMSASSSLPAASELKKDVEDKRESFSPSPSPNIKGRRGKKPKKIKDPSAPKRNMNSFMWFSLNERPKIKAESPDMGHFDILKELGKRWNDCSVEVKVKFEEMAENDRVRYEAEKSMYDSKMKSDDGKKDCSVDTRDE